MSGELYIRFLDVRPLMKKSDEQTVHGLRMLLDRLDTENLRAAEKYYHLLGVLTLFLENRMGQALDSDDLARKTLDIVAEKLASGVDIKNIQAYSFAVAKNLLHAYRRRPVCESVEDQDVVVAGHSYPAIQETMIKEIEEECRQKCLQSLDPDRRDLIMRYYQRGLHSKAYREELAQELSLSVEALGNRISRIKKKLSACHLDCVRSRQESNPLWH
jgi:DNA-directed RNA polymerase specialized sigma24 family protein